MVARTTLSVTMKICRVFTSAFFDGVRGLISRMEKVQIIRRKTAPPFDITGFLPLVAIIL